MGARDPGEPDEVVTLAEAEAHAAATAAEAARARAKLLKLQQDRAETEAITEVAEAAEPAPETTTAVAEPAGWRSRIHIGWVGRHLPAVAAALVALAVGGLLVSDVLMLVGHRAVIQRERQAAEYSAAARQGVVTVMSLNYETVDDDVKRILDNSTGEFRKDFEAHADDFIKTAREAKAIAEAAATVSGIESMSANEAVVLVAATTKVTNAAGAKEELRSWRLTIHMTRDGDQAKVSKVDFAT